MRLLKPALAAFGLALAFTAAPALAAPKPEIYTAKDSNLAAEGYDVVAYFTEGKPVKGSAEFSIEYKKATWLFTSKDHLDKFKEKPEAYAPQYGGYCAYGVSADHAVRGDPKQWKIVDGKLYLNYNAGVQKKWLKNIPGYNTKADANWPKVLGE